jgi:hypothetical protein
MPTVAPPFDEASLSWRDYNVGEWASSSAVWALAAAQGSTAAVAASHGAGSSGLQVPVVRYVFNNPASAKIRTSITTAYVVTFVAGLLGNVLVLYVLAALGIARVGGGGTRRGRASGVATTGGGVGYGPSLAGARGVDPFRTVVIRTKSVANCYIANLAVADLLFASTLPLFCWATLVADWPFGAVACKMAYAMRENNKFVGVYVLVALSFDRYLASHYDLGRWRTLAVGTDGVSCRLAVVGRGDDAILDVRPGRR